MVQKQSKLLHKIRKIFADKHSNELYKTQLQSKRNAITQKSIHGILDLSGGIIGKMDHEIEAKVIEITNQADEIGISNDQNSEELQIYTLLIFAMKKKAK